MRHTLLISAAALSLMGLGVPAMAYDGVTVFGDSLSDVGNIAILEGLPPMRFTTNPGPVTVDIIAAQAGFTLKPVLQQGNDYAFGGAGVVDDAPGVPRQIPTVTTQVDSYLFFTGGRADPNQLYVVFAGGNDIFYHTAAARGEADVPAETLAQAATALGNTARQEVALVGALQAAGARTVVVFSAPDIGVTPQSQGQGQFQGQPVNLSAGYNQTLYAGIAGLKRGIIPVDIFDLSHEEGANPAAFGFRNTSTPACTTPSSLTCTAATLVAPDAATTYSFADAIHPTTGAHAIIAAAYLQEIAAPGRISLLAEQPLGFADTQRAAVRAQGQSDGGWRQDDPAAGTGVRLFVQASYAGRSFEARGGAPRTADDDGQITAGAEAGLGRGTTVGAAIGGATGHATFSGQGAGSGGGGFSDDAVIGSVFLRQRLPAGAYVSAQAGYGGLDFNAVGRSFNLGPLRRTERGDTSGDVVLAEVEGGFWYDLGLGRARVRTGPYAQLGYTRIGVDAYAETGGDSTAMRFERQTRQALVGEVGWRLTARLPTRWGEVQPFGSLAFDHDADAGSRLVTAGLTQMPGEFALAGFAPGRDWGGAEAGVSARLGGRWTLSLAYRGRFGDAGQSSSGADVGLRYTF